MKIVMDIYSAFTIFWRLWWFQWTSFNSQSKYSQEISIISFLQAPNTDSAIKLLKQNCLTLKMLAVLLVAGIVLSKSVFDEYI